ncbi:MAG: hypothetical protein R3A10_17930 [Caldilineaceae bacterium]
MLTATVDTTDWSAGRHTVFVEAQDSDGNWGVPTAVFVDMLAAHAVALGGVTTQAGKPGETITYTGAHQHRGHGRQLHRTSHAAARVDLGRCGDA